MDSTGSPEHQLLFSCIGAALGRDIPSNDWPLGADSDVDWERFTAIAIQQAVAPIVFRGLKTLKVTSPDSVSQRLWGAIAVASRDQRWLSRTLAESIASLHQSGIEPIVLKGAASAYTVYPEPWYRCLWDVDLLVLPTELQRSEDVLRCHGFSRNDTFEAEFPRVNHHSPPLHLSGSTIALELHRELLSDPCPYRIDLNRVRGRAQRTSLGGTEALVLSPADAIHHTCVHLSYAHRYSVTPLRGIADILGLSLGKAGVVDWNELIHSARAAGTSGAVYWPLRMSRDWLGALIPDTVLDALSPPGAVRQLLASFAHPSFILELRAPSDPGAAALYGMLRDISRYAGCSIAVQAWALWRYGFPPSDDVGHLPPAVTGHRLRFGAYLANPVRISRGIIAFGRLIARARAA